MQVYNSPYTSCTQCMLSVYRKEGVKAFYRSYITQLSINIPFQSLHFILYETCQDKMNKERRYDPKTHMISGAIAGGMAAGATTPLDVCKTLLNIQETHAVSREGTITGITHAIKTIYKYRGWSGFFQGMTARVLYVMPGTAISWSVYEFFKFVITKRKSSANCDGKIAVHAVQPHKSS